MCRHDVLPDCVWRSGVTGGTGSAVSHVGHVVRGEHLHDAGSLVSGLTCQVHDNRSGEQLLTGHNLSFVSPIAIIL